MCSLLASVVVDFDFEKSFIFVEIHHQPFCVGMFIIEDFVLLSVNVFAFWIVVCNSYVACIYNILTFCANLLGGEQA